MSFTVGETFELSMTFTPDLVIQFAALTGDQNPVHTDPEYAAKTAFGEPIVHGMFVASVISRALGCNLPGYGTIYLGQSLRFLAPVMTHDTIRIRLEIAEVLERGRLRIITRAFNERGIMVVDGEALVRGPKATTAEERQS